jgi:hypothetical protein
VVFWLLSRWSAPFSQTVLKTLFWMNQLTLLAAMIGAMYLVSDAPAPIPEDIVFNRPPPTPLRSLMTFLTLTGALSLMGFAAAAFWSVFRKLEL